MRPFVFHNPTRLIFGKGKLSALKEEVSKYGKNVLLVYGGGSIKRSGLYDQVLSLLKEAGASVTELAGVEPNPRLSTVHKGVSLCREHSIDLILAVGGGASLTAPRRLPSEPNTTGICGISSSARLPRKERFRLAPY